MLALIDCNNFYASCERVFNPALRKKPLAILSNNDGCVIARSNEAKQIGVRMGHPAFELRELVSHKNLILLSSNFILYGDMSRRVMETLATFAFDMEVYSIDEAFLHLESDSLENLGRAIRARVLQWTGIPVSIGIAPTKTLAKLANEKAKKKPDHKGVFSLTNLEKREKILEETLLQDIWGIGKRMAFRLQKKMIHNGKAFKDQDDLWIRKQLGVTGLKSAMELRGTPCFSLDEKSSIKKSILCSRSFYQTIENPKVLYKEIAKFTVRAAEKLRYQKSLAKNICVFIATSPFNAEKYYSNSCSFQLPLATDYTPELLKYVKKGLNHIFKKGCAYKRAGVLLTDFSSRENRQKDFFSSEKNFDKKMKIMQTIDALNAQYDKEAVFFASEGLNRNFRSLKSKVSPRYTTNWKDIPTVRT